jgi:hypothetical protein
VVLKVIYVTNLSDNLTHQHAVKADVLTNKLEERLHAIQESGAAAGFQDKAVLGHKHAALTGKQKHCQGFQSELASVTLSLNNYIVELQCNHPQPFKKCTE